MLIVFDLGNTRIKWWEIENRRVISQGAAEYDACIDRLALLKGGYRRVLGSSVRSRDFNQFFETKIKKLFNCSIDWASSQSHFAELINGYEDYSKLGVDRWLGMIGVHSQGIDSFVLVSLGTAVTVDVVVRNHHLGGLIGPGKKVFFESLGQATAGVQVVSFSQETEHLGLNTNEAVGKAFLSMIEGMVMRARLQVPKNETAPLFITGGDAHLMVSSLPNAQVDSDVVLKGICVHFDEVLLKK